MSARTGEGNCLLFPPLKVRGGRGGYETRPLATFSSNFVNTFDNLYDKHTKTLIFCQVYKIHLTRLLTKYIFYDIVWCYDEIAPKRQPIATYRVTR